MVGLNAGIKGLGSHLCEPASPYSHVAPCRLSLRRCLRPDLVTGGGSFLDRLRLVSFQENPLRSLLHQLRVSLSTPRKTPASRLVDPGPLDTDICNEILWAFLLFLAAIWALLTPFA